MTYHNEETDSELEPMRREDETERAIRKADRTFFPYILAMIGIFVVVAAMTWLGYRSNDNSAATTEQSTVGSVGANGNARGPTK